MKKNKMMRVAGALMVVTLLTLSIVSGTFAKYVTSDSESGSARVAKFGVDVVASGTLFDKTYKAATNNGPGGEGAEDTNDTALTVESSTNVVAPGTKNADGLALSITGTPEVDVQVAINVTVNNDVVLKANNALPDKTTGNSATFDNKKDYYPVVYTLKKGTEVLKSGNLTDIKTKLESYAGRYDAGTNLTNTIGNLTLTWEWDFDNEGAGTYDKQDTLLGDLAAGTATVDSSLYNINAGVEITLSVTQID